MPRLFRAVTLAAALASFGSAAMAETPIPATRYEVIKSGAESGARPMRNSAVKVRYTGTHVDGTVFDSSVGKNAEGAVIFPLRGLIPGYQSALMMMRPGDRWRITIPPEQAYGSNGHPLSGKTLVFDLELIDFAELPPAAPPPAIDTLPGR